jgi:heavy metal efflux system protein
MGLELPHISAGVGYIAVFGVSVLNSVVLVSSIRQALDDGLSGRDASNRRCELRFWAIMVSAIVAVIGFLLAALSHGIGAEIQVVIGGLISPTVLTLLALPAVYALGQHRGPSHGSPKPPDPRRHPGEYRAPLDAAAAS